ncbi:YybH family protein [Indiicoccus explosivorum]|uniref:YybH family protein n=1 Tax=Indiicoccus explosivorum TaxID=1917864 RepID=UPI000B43954E|nr:nuclear transport factor 2 family protein [Indiicoccus explosivorum]
MKKWMLAAGMAALLAGCSGEEEAQNPDTAEAGYENTNDAVGHGIADDTVADDAAEDDTVGFTMGEDGMPVAAEVPKDERDALLDAYDAYIQAFNDEDLDAFMDVLAENPEGFDREEDKQLLIDTFEQFETTYTPSDVTVVKYEEDRAEVFAVIDVDMVDAEADTNLSQTGRQVVVFAKEDGDWKVTSLHFIGNQ